MTITAKRKDLTIIALNKALNNPKWINHKIGDTYTMDGKPDLWKIAYYPIFENGKTGELYGEPRALIEKPIKGGIDFREIPFRYLIPTKIRKNKDANHIQQKGVRLEI